MNRIILLFLALLWAVAADDEVRRLKNDDYAEGDLCLKSLGLLFHVTGDQKFWRSQKDVSRPGKCKPKKGYVGRHINTFCGKIGGRTHELRAAAVFTKMVEDAGFKEGECKEKSGRKHKISMTIGADPGTGTGTDLDDDCYCEKSSGCLCPCDCNKPGAFEVDRNYVRRIRRRNRPNRTNRRKRNRRQDPFE